MPLYSDLEQLPEDPILSIPPLYKADPRAEKINLSIGAYQDEEGRPVVFDAVREAEKTIFENQMDKEYLPIEGDREYIEATLRLVLGESPCLAEHRISALQTVGASSALHLSGKLLKRIKVETIFLANPSWANHRLLYSQAGLEIGTYPYYDSQTHRICFDSLCQAVEQFPVRSAMLLQGSCHNPTGRNLSENEWRALSHLLKKKQIIPVLDISYQGLGQDLEKDAFAVRLFAKEHTPLICASFSKNFGLYGERAGLLAAVLPDKGLHPKVMSNLKQLVRGIYSSPPLQAARIIKTILNTPTLNSLWREQLHSMQQRLKAMRSALANGLTARNNAKDFSFITEEEGFFSLLGLSKEQVLWLREAKGIYLTENGRINIAGLSSNTLPAVIPALLDAYHRN